MKQVRREHSRALAPILEKMTSGEETKAKAEAAQLCSNLLAKLHVEVQTIEDSLAAGDLGALRSIAVEPPKDSH